MQATKPFNRAEASLGDHEIHVCSQVAPSDYFTSLPEYEAYFTKSVDAIRAVLHAFEYQFGEEIATVGEEKSRAIY